MPPFLFLEEIMAHVFERNYVDEQNKGYSRGDVVPAYLEENKVKINFLLADGIIKEVESVAAFMKKVEATAAPEQDEEAEVLDEIESLDPDKKRKRK
jgi:hypothetical protein